MKEDKDNLPEAYRDENDSETNYEVPDWYNDPIFEKQADFHWIVEYVEMILDQSTYRDPSVLTKEERIRLKEYRKEMKEYRREIKEELDVLWACWGAIENETTLLLNLIADSYHKTWNDCDLTTVRGYDNSKIQMSNNLIPRDIQDLVYTLSSRYYSLVKCAIYATDLSNNVDELLRTDNRSSENASKNWDALKVAVSTLHRDICLLDNRERNHYQRTKEIIKGEQRRTRRIQITQEECANILYSFKVQYLMKRESFCRNNQIEVPPNAFKVPSKKSVLRRVQRWDRAIKKNEESPRYPPKGYSREMNPLQFIAWAMNMEKEKYAAWLEYQRTHHLVHYGNIDEVMPEQESEDEGNSSYEDDYQVDGKINLVDRLTQNRKMYSSRPK